MILPSEERLRQLRLASEDQVIDACESMNCRVGGTAADLLEFFNRMLDMMGVPDADGDVPEPIH